MILNGIYLALPLKLPLLWKPLFPFSVEIISHSMFTDYIIEKHPRDKTCKTWHLFCKEKRGFTRFIGSTFTFVKKGKLFVKHVSISKSNYRPLCPLQCDTGHSVQANPYQTATQKSKVNIHFFLMLNILRKRSRELQDLQLHSMNQHNVLCTHPLDGRLHWRQRWNELKIVKCIPLS